MAAGLLLLVCQFVGLAVGAAVAAVSAGIITTAALTATTASFP